MDGENNNKGQWFVIQTLSGQEKRVFELIQHGIAAGEAPKVYEACIPTEKVTEVRQGVKKTLTRKFFPGYILVRMDLYNLDEDGRMVSIDEAPWYYVKETKGVIGFIGGNTPRPLSDSEADEIFRQANDDEVVKPKIAFELGEVVRIRHGAFENFEGTIQEIDNDRGKLRLMVSIFGRSTPVELEFWQVDREV
jgi:transcriptional antiterminator NusG